ncbi:hypothetical protein N9Y42_09350 [Mariniblastus sp.]|nr:hypothetical protein [Mariniblastus sp.]
MNQTWLTNTITCDNVVLCDALDTSTPLLPLRAEIEFRALLLFNAWTAHCCDGRQMSFDAVEQMEVFESLFSDESQSENNLRATISEFGSFIPEYLCETTVRIPRRALYWTNQPPDGEFVKQYENTTTSGARDGLIGCGIGGCVVPFLLMALAGLLGGIGSPVSWLIIAFICGVIEML